MIKSIYFIFILFACQPSTVQHSVETIDSQKLKQLQTSGVEIIDIRTSREYTDGHIPNVSNIDFMSDDFIQLMSVKDKKEPIIIHCASGGRSKRAAYQLSELGFEKIYDYSGGFADWKAKGEKIEK